MAINALNESGQPIGIGNKRNVAPEKKKSSKTGIVIFALFLLLLVGVVLYLTLAPAVCPVLYRIPESVVSAPAGAEVLSVVADGPVAKGEVVAELLIRSDTGGMFIEQTNLLRDRLMTMDAEDAAGRDAQAQLTAELEGLRSQMAVAGADAGLAAQARRQSDAACEVQQKRLDTAKRLFELEAIRHSELTAAQDDFAAAAGEAEKAALTVRKTTLEIERLKIRIAAAETRLRNAEAAAASRDGRNAVFRRQLEEQLTQVDFVPGGVAVRLRAGCDGVVCGTGLQVGGRVEAGAPVVRIYPNGAGRIEVFVPESMAAALTRESQFYVTIGGDSFEAVTTALSPYMENLPNPLKGQVRNPNLLYRRATLTVPENSAGLINGQAGTAIMH